MNKRRIHRTVLFIGLIGLLTAASGSLWLRAQRWQYALDRQLIAALVKADDQQALALVNAGANPNTHLKPSSPLSFGQLWNYMVRRTALPTNDSPTAFMIASGGAFDSGDHAIGPTTMNAPEHPELIQAMLAHHVNIHVSDCYGTPPLVCAARYPATLRVLLERGDNVSVDRKAGYTAAAIACLTGAPDSLRLLLDHGANITSGNDGGAWLLFLVVKFSPRGPKSAEVLSQLLAQGAKPDSLAEGDLTILELAQHKKRLDMVALLRKYGAKK